MINLELSDEDFELLSYLVDTYPWDADDEKETTEQFDELRERMNYLKYVRDKVHNYDNKTDIIPLNTSINILYQ